MRHATDNPAQGHDDEFVNDALTAIRRRLRSPDHEPTLAHHRDGNWWYKAPIPPRLHSCHPHTVGWTERSGIVFRCACGAVRLCDGGDSWLEKNSRH